MGSEFWLQALTLGGSIAGYVTDDVEVLEAKRHDQATGDFRDTP